MNGTIENEQKYETDSYAREKRIWPDGPKEELHHISDRELCETLTDTNCRKFKRTYNQNEGATILDLSSSFFFSYPFENRNLDRQSSRNVIGGTLPNQLLSGNIRCRWNFIK